MTESIRSAKSTTKQAAKEAAARPRPRADKADGESAVLAKIAEMPEPDRFFRDTQKFKERYLTLGFNQEANLDEGAM
jgi:hypothetical protein